MGSDIGIGFVNESFRDGSNCIRLPNFGKDGITKILLSGLELNQNLEILDCLGEVVKAWVLLIGEELIQDQGFTSGVELECKWSCQGDNPNQIWIPVG